jgi:glycosyltransferase involved in cell wall biosynthesis
VKEILKYYKEKDERIKVIYRTENGHISKASNSALSLAAGDYIALLDHDDELPEFALFFVVKEINDHPEVKLIYSDEDKLYFDESRVSSYFKSDWNPDLFLSQNMISHLGVYKKYIVDEIGGFREGYEGSQDYDLALRFIEKVKPNEIRHIPRVLYHWRMTEGSTAVSVESKSYAVIAARKAVQDHLDRLNVKAKVVEAPLLPMYQLVIYDIGNNPLVSIIIPTHNGDDILKKCIDGILTKTTYKNYEIIIVNNNSNDEQTLKYLKLIDGSDNIRVIDYNKPFNYSAINNFAVKFAKGDIIVLLNNSYKLSLIL